jgi:predicted dithiol-disulfide oxidoreductase (DUF899 family)
MATDAEIQAIQKQIEDLKAKLSEARRNRAAEEVENHTLTYENGNPIKLFDLFGDKDELLVIHNMGRSCPYCTLWADGFNGLVDHFESRASFVVVSPDSPEEQAEFAKSRGWRFRMISGMGGDFIEAMGYKMPEGYWPGVSAFRRDGNKIYRTGKDFFGPGDDYCSVWRLFDLFPSGDGGWEPKFRYK